MSDSRAELSERESALARRKAAERSATTVDHRPQHPVLRLQRQVGNAQVARMLAQREGEEDELQMKRDPAVQRSEGGEAEEEELQMKRDPALQRGGGRRRRRSR